MLDSIKKLLEGIAYGLMLEIIFIPVYAIVGVALLGVFGVVFHKRTTKNASTVSSDT